MKTFLALLALASAGASWAELPRRSEHDDRVRYATYKADGVVTVNVRRGVVTRLVLEADERIVNSGTGFSARCDNDGLEWCIRADKDANQVWIKPRDGATHNNLELATTKRDYSIRLNVLPDAGASAKAEAFYRVIFQYPMPALTVPLSLLTDPIPGAEGGAGQVPRRVANTPASSKTSAVDHELATPPVARNTDYSMKTIKGGDLVAPSMVFDDGRFTYLRFPSAREVPSPFVIGPDGEEVRANFHMDGDLMVLHRIAPAFVLRLGSAVVGIWNEAFDADGIATPTGTVQSTVRRELK
jgi:type IV secretion system protein VirB9